jgi:outer membrane protein assembly factor BamB
MGFSANQKYVYVKTMDGDLLGIATKADKMEITWKSNLKLPYELTPSAIATNNKIVFVPSHSGLLSAVDAKSGALLWQFKISNGMINPVLVLGNNELVCSTMDGKIIKLKF